MKTKVESRPAFWFEKWRGRIGEAKDRVEGRGDGWRPHPPRMSPIRPRRRK